MKQFNLDEYLKNPSKKVITGSGKSVRIICTNKLDNNYPVVALVHDGYCEKCYSYTTFGKLYTNQSICRELDLFFAPEKHEGWLNIYHSESGFYLRGTPYKTKEEAEEVAKANHETFCTTIKFEWEE